MNIKGGAGASNDKAFQQDDEVVRRPERYANRWIKLAQVINPTRFLGNRKS